MPFLQPQGTAYSWLSPALSWRHWERRFYVFHVELLKSVFPLFPCCSSRHDACGRGRGWVSQLQALGMAVSPATGDGRTRRKKKTLRKSVFPVNRFLLSLFSEACVQIYTHTQIHTPLPLQNKGLICLSVCCFAFFLIFECEMQSRNWYEQNRAIWDLCICPLSRDNERHCNYFSIKR